MGPDAPDHGFHFGKFGHATIPRDGQIVISTATLPDWQSSRGVASNLGKPIRHTNRILAGFLVELRADDALRFRARISQILLDDASPQDDAKSL